MGISSFIHVKLFLHLSSLVFSERSQKRKQKDQNTRGKKRKLKYVIDSKDKNPLLYTSYRDDSNAVFLTEMNKILLKKAVFAIFRRSVCLLCLL